MDTITSLPHSAEGETTATTTAQAGAAFVLRAFLDAILEVATLYGMSFGENSSSNSTAQHSSLLTDFITEAFSTFLSHVQSILLEELSRIKEDNDDDEGPGVAVEDDSDVLLNAVAGVVDDTAVVEEEKYQTP